MRQSVQYEDMAAVFPATPDELLALKEDVELCQGKHANANFWEWAPDHAQDFALFYVGAEPVGIVRLDCYHSTVHYHGSVRPGWEHSGVTRHATVCMFRYIFGLLKKRAVFVTVPKGNRLVKAFVDRWKFTRSHNTKEGWVFRLDRETYLKRIIADVTSPKQA